MSQFATDVLIAVVFFVLGGGCVYFYYKPISAKVAAAEQKVGAAEQAVKSEVDKVVK